MEKDSALYQLMDTRMHSVMNGIVIISRRGIRSGTLFRSIESLLRTSGSPLGSARQQVISCF